MIKVTVYITLIDLFNSNLSFFKHFLGIFDTCIHDYWDLKHDKNYNVNLNFWIIIISNQKQPFPTRKIQEYTVHFDT